MRIEQYRDMIYACGRCEFCRGTEFSDRCPQIFTQRWESSTARGRMAIARAILEGKLDYSKDLRERVFGCFLCGRCREECKKAAKIDIVAVTKAMRADFVDKGIGAPEEGSKMTSTMSQKGNIFADPAAEHTKWAQGIKFQKGSGTLFFPGCLASHRFKEKTRIVVQVLQAAGYKLDFLGDDQKCCGTPMWVTGDVKAAKQWAQDYVKKMKARGVKEIITPCPSCFRAFDEEYTQLLGLKEPPFKVRHTSQVLEEIVTQKRLPLKTNVAKVVTYHDPCEIGRYRGMYDQARKVLTAIPGVQLKEMSRIREQAFCCGGGGGLKIMYPDYSQQVSEERLRDALKTSASVLATICPACELNLTHAAYKTDAPLRVADVAEIIAVSAGLADEAILEPDYISED